jgi:hypothetical protein
LTKKVKLLSVGTPLVVLSGRFRVLITVRGTALTLRTLYPCSYLESSFILAARTFLSHFLSLALAAYPSLLVVQYPYPPPGSPLAASPSPPASDELLMTKLASLNFLQLAVRAAQAGSGEAVEKTKAPNGEMRAVRGQTTRVWQGLVTRYEKQVPWLKQGELKEVRTLSGETLISGVS